ncbi:MAG TPA: YfiR family protein, partial [Candidatus Paceibacterota bacterium]|nr:YfiR family protein [Candidatus Paceibacterota bacterium]
HSIIVLEPENEAEWSKCQILFVGGSDKGRIQSVLNKVRNLPLLTVGEAEPFAEAGGIINFVKKENKVRFEVDLAAARLAKLEISSRVLVLADVVRGK